MARNIRTIQHTSRPAWRRYRFDDDKRLGQNCVSGNGTGNAGLFGEVLAGTLMALDASGDGIRPLGLQALSSGIAAANEGEMADASGFFPGDVIDLVAAVDTFDAATIDADGAGGTIDVTALEAGDSRIRVILSDPSANSSPLAVTISDDGTNHDIDVSLETDGGGTIVSTVAEVIAALNDAAGHLVFAELNAATGAETAVAVTATALTGGFLIGEVIVDGRNVTDVDKTASPNTVTFDGAVVTVDSGTIIMIEDMTPARLAGVLERQIQTIALDNGSIVGVDQQCEVAIGGYAIDSELTGYDATLQRYLSGAWVSEGVLGAGQAPIFPFVIGS